jgi:hypothetical protein
MVGLKQASLLPRVKLVGWLPKLLVTYSNVDSQQLFYKQLLIQDGKL